MVKKLEDIKQFIFGKARKPDDPNVFHNISLIAFFAWVGLGADGLSSSCYGPQEVFLVLNQYKYLSIFLALAIMVTVTIISLSYSQIVELFPTGGGGYLVGSKLLSPTIGMISGSALLIDYVLTITTSIASGVDAVFSFLPASIISYKIFTKVFIVVILIILNIRGTKETIIPLIPIFLTFVFTHFFLIGYGIVTHLGNFHEVTQGISTDLNNATSSIGVFGVILLLLHSFSMGAGTYTGIEAVSNGMNIIRVPKVANAKRTMFYMATSLAFTAAGIIIIYLLFQVSQESGKTLNATVFERITSSWGIVPSRIILLITLLSEALLLFVAAQTGFIGGPSIIANMSIDRWFPTRFSGLSDRLVTKDGILLMGIAALITMIFTNGSVSALLVLYSISVFITFTISQFGMVIHWIKVRKKEKIWKKKILINSIGLVLTVFILISVVTVKFMEGGWITLVIIGSLVLIALIIKNYYKNTFSNIKKLDTLVEHINESNEVINKDVAENIYNPKDKTAVLLVSGFNGLGLHTLFNIFYKFNIFFKNYVFVEIGIVDAGNFKGTDEIKNLEKKVKNDINQYVKYMNSKGYFAKGYYSIGIDTVTEIEKLAVRILKKFPNSLFFGGQLVFRKESFFSRFLHNYTIFSIQKSLYQKGIPVIVLPIKI